MDRGGLAYAAAFVVALIAAAVAYDAISAWAVHQAEDVDAEAAAARRSRRSRSVSYTHLTLPTICSV